MKQQVVSLFLLSLVLLASCKKEAKYNPFETPEGCIKEYLEANDSCDIVRMLKCFSYDPKYESLLRDNLQEEIDRKKRDYKNYPDFFIKIDSVKLKGVYPNSAVVTVHYTKQYTKDEKFSDEYDMNLVKDSTNWKIEVRMGFGLSTN